MMPSLPSLLLCTASVLSLVSAEYPTDLVGTWTSKSKKVLTGPGFYNPVTDRLIEPELTGISYSFTADGFYEEAYYRAVANPTTPSCPSSVMQWQHGTYSVSSNSSITLEPFSVDGRQVMSSPCSYDVSVYTRYEQAEYMTSYRVFVDPFHNVKRLDLYLSDGSPLMPLYLAMTPPRMLPTITLNPTSTATATSSSKVKRDVGGGDEGLVQAGLLSAIGRPSFLPTNADLANPDKWWWAGVGFIAIGTVLYLWPSSM
ncbi:hypothetical protein DV737_g4726, partial [Chaetothyriales sp. CBS 132003]